MPQATNGLRSSQARHSAHVCVFVHTQTCVCSADILVFYFADMRVCMAVTSEANRVAVVEALREVPLRPPFLPSSVVFCLLLSSSVFFDALSNDTVSDDAVSDAESGPRPADPGGCGDLSMPAGRDRGLHDPAPHRPGRARLRERRGRCAPAGILRHANSARKVPAHRLLPRTHPCLS